MKKYRITPWPARQPREQRLLLCAAAALGILLLHGGWQWSVGFRDAARQALADEQRALRNLPALEQKLAQRHSTPPAVSPPALDDLHRLAGEMGLALRLRHEGSRYRLHAPIDVAFPTLIRWLEALETRWDVRASRLQLQRQQQRLQLLQLELQYGS
ncbi:type II secretion system protein GspM [Pantoea sp. 1.19]|uniref:type II secretion system protein GspM n=1 Tax=Pantoea sp. 1.19 TaxID=1925589 RepID=UPI0009491D00|nr:type II secretion system protein GspM [Pantoea sp. 1.19]